jgi:tetratricopeptide (TPR) repeat protein
VARGTQHRKRRPQTNARLTPVPAGPRRPKRPAYEDQLFFGKLRVHAKWVFLLMAVVFMGGFVFLGIGSGSNGITDAVQGLFNGTSANGPSLSSLEKKTTEHPKDAAAWLAYANKLQQKQKLDDAAQALTAYTKLKPKDANALQQLAGIYLTRAQDWQTLYQNSSNRTTALSPTPVTPPSGSKLAEALNSITSPLTTAVSSAGSAATSNEYSKVQSFLSNRVTVYKQLAKLSPDDATTQLSLAQAAGIANDSATAITAYKAFLKLAPSDSQAPQARKTLKQLEAAQSASPGAQAGGTQSATVGGSGTHVINVP